MFWNKRNQVKKLINSYGYADVYIDPSTFINNSQYVTIGKNCWIGGNNRILANYPGISIGNNVIMADHIVLFSNFHNYNDTSLLPFDNKTIAKPICIQDNVWIGMYSIIFPGVKIEEGAVIGAGSIVTKSVPKCAVVGGNPAEIIKYRDLNKYEELKERKYFKNISIRIENPEFIVINSYNNYMVKKQGCNYAQTLTAQERESE